jgi:hypothetical protein
MTWAESTIAGQTPPRILRAEECAAAILLQHDLVPAAQVLDQGLRLVATERARATTVSVHLGARALFLVKLGAPPSQSWGEREIRCYRALDAIAPGGAIAPALVQSDLRQCVLVIQLLDPVITLHDHFSVNSLYAPAVLDGLSRAMTVLHTRSATRQLDAPSAMPWILSEAVEGGDTGLGEILPDAGARAALLQRLAKARTLWREEALIHGDLKWDNCLLIDAGSDGTPAAVRLVDWELGGKGDPAWDLATALQEFVFHAHPECMAGSTPFGWLATSEPGRAAGHLLHRYLRLSNLTDIRRDDFLARVGIYAGCRLVQTAFELAAVQGGQGPGARTAMDMALRVGEHPDELVAVLGGIHS